MLPHRFRAWLDRGGACIGSVECSLVKEGGRGLVATSDIEADELIVSIPECLLLSCPSARSCPEFVQAWNLLGRHLEPEVVLACHLLHELSRGQRSFWQPYLSNLPRTFTALAYFSSRDVHELQLGHAMDIVQSVAEALTSSHEAAGPLLAALGLQGPHLSLSAWRWAATLVGSRTMYLPHEPAGALVPFADLLNHQPPPGALIPDLDRWPGGGGTASLGTSACSGRHGDGAYDADAKRYMLHARKAYVKGEQVFLNYGEHSNLQLLEHYGFVLADNPHDTMLLPVRLLPSAQLRSAVRASDCWLHACGTPCWVLLRELRLWAAAQLGCRHLQYLAFEGRQISTDSDRLVLQTLQAMCTDVLAGLPTQFEEDSKLLAGCDPELPCLHMALTWRHSYKRDARQAEVKIEDFSCEDGMPASLVVCV